MDLSILKYINGLRGFPYHHKDPFDRIMIAQAIVGGHKIVAKDSIIKKYDVETVWNA